MIDVNSPTWKHILAFLEREQINAIEMLVNDIDSDYQRGALLLMDKLVRETEAPDLVPPSDEYH